MKKPAKKIIAELAAEQWGMFTVAQAQAAGVSRTQVKRMADSGYVEEMRRGVYRQNAGFESPWDWVKAAWLSTEPGRTAFERLGDNPPAVVVGGETAACIHGSRELWETPFTFVVPSRRQTSREDIRYLRRLLTKDDVVSVGGLPVASVEEAVAELVLFGSDPSHIENFLRDVAVSGGSVDELTLAAKLSPLAKKNDQRDGASFAIKLLSGGYYQIRGKDAVRLAQEAVAAGDSDVIESIRRVVS